MSKRRNKQQSHLPRQSVRLPHAAGPSSFAPSAATLFRLHIVDQRTRAMLRRIPEALQPILRVRDRERVEQVRQAATAVALIDLAPIATGLAETVWQDRMRQLGADVIPLIADRLIRANEIRDADDRTLLRERLISELRWHGAAGAEALLSCFDSLDDYGRSLGSVVLGLLGAQSGADRIWNYYQKVVRNTRERYLVGALWGLIDLHDRRAAGALVDLLHRRQLLYELPGFLSLAGDAQAIVPLLHTIVRVPEADRLDFAMALTSIAQRIGKEALVAELDKTLPDGKPPEVSHERADQILARPASAAEEYFALFYRGLTPEDLAQALGA